MFALDAAFPHTLSRAPSRQFEIAECRCQPLLLPILCGVARAVQTVLQQPAQGFVTWLVIFWPQFDKYSASCWSAEVRLSHVKTVPQPFLSRLPVAISHSTTFSASSGGVGDVQLWPRVRLVFLRDPPRAHIGLPWLSLVSVCPSFLDRCLPRLT